MKPELLHDERVACRTDTARLLYYGLMGLIDDSGRALASPAYLHGQIFWGQPRSLRKISAATLELIEAGLIRVYDVSGNQYLEVVDIDVRGSLTYQQIDRRQPSNHPEPSQGFNPPSTASTRGARAASSPQARLDFAVGSDPIRSGTDQEPNVGASAPDLGSSPGEKTSPDHQPALERFHELYFGAYGTKPTWGGKQVAMLKRLVASHTASEVVRRMEILFSNPPAWLRPPYDVSTLVQHFDKLAAVAVDPVRRDARGGLSAADLLAIAAEERAKGVAS